MKFADSFKGDLYISAVYYYDKNNENDWRLKDGRPIKDWKAMFNVWNNRAKRQGTNYIKYH